jgi:ABC-type transport system involved in cytochrome c biogenesis permease subunit
MNLTQKELRYINEMIMTIGLFMLTIGTFLGGVWANESWGRYWGWDPKETWALASALVYAIILHLRFVPGLKSDFTFNTAAFWGYSSIIMTFYGVNYYLAGLHSYATGEPVPIPLWVPITIAIFLSINIYAYIRHKKFKHKKK